MTSFITVVVYDVIVTSWSAGPYITIDPLLVPTADGWQTGAFLHLLGSQTVVRDRPVEGQLAASVGSSPAEMAELRKRLQRCLVSELKEIARRPKLPSCVGKRKGELIENLLKLGQDGALDASLLEEQQTQSIKLDDQVPELALTLEVWFMRGKENSSSVCPRLRNALGKMTVQGLCVLAKSVKARLTNAIGKGDIVERLLAVSRVGSLTVHAEEDEWSGLSYISDSIKVQLASLPPFANVQSWSKSLDCLKQFHFVNLIVYLIECRDKTFDQESMRAFKSLKAYRFFADGYVKNMWLYQYPGSSLIVLRAYCHHSLTNDPALQVFVCTSGMTGDVYTAQCNCVSGLGAACSHIAAVLFALEDVVRKGLKELPVELSKTSKPMEWNKPPKKHISPLPV